MCDNSIFRLCTCDKSIPPNTSYWTLKRFSACDWMKMEIGRCFYPEYQDDDKAWIGKVQTWLNASNCFDNGYTPCESDVLNLTFYQANKILKMEFEFRDSQWQSSLSISEHLNQKKTIFAGSVLLIDLSN